MAEHQASDSRPPLWREPLLHFLVLGGLVFAANAWLVGPEGEPEAEEEGARTGARVEPDTRIVLSEAHRADLARTWERRMGRPADEAEMKRMIQQWVEREILYREALAMGLHEDDMVVRNQIISKLSTAYQSLAHVPEPSEEQLRAYLEREYERYDKPERFDIVHVFSPAEDGEGQTKVEGWKGEIEAGADPLTLGPRFPKGRRFRLRTQADLESMFGEDFAVTVAAASVGVWTVVESKYGWHAVQIGARHPPQPGEFGALRERLRGDYERDVREREVREQVLRLRERYEVELPDGQVVGASELVGPGRAGD